MRIAPGREPGTPSIRPDTFTGTVWSDTLLSREDGLVVLAVMFNPRARTRWHTHDSGQVLFVTHGSGLVATRHGVQAMVRSGDVVHFGPGEEHWHGAGPHTFLVHTSVSIGVTTLLEEVTDAAYERTAATA